MHFVNLCIPLGDKFEDARYFCMFVFWICLLPDANKGSQTNPGHFKEFGFSKLNKSSHAQVPIDIIV